MSVIRHRLNRSLSSGLSTIILCSAVGMLWYVTLGGESGLAQLTTFLIYGLFALGVDFLWGYAGMLSFGQAAFFGLGCYSYAVITTGKIAPIPPEASLVGIVVGITMPILVALLLGYFLFYGKVKGPYFTIVTLALSFLLSSLTAAWPSLFGGWTGIANVPSLGSTFLGIDVSLTKPISGFIVVTILCGFVVSGFRWILNSQFGLLVDGLKDNEERLQYLGIDVAKVKLAIFAISAGVAGFAGILYSAQSGYVAPELIGVTFSTEVIIFVAVGGRGTLVGAILGTIIVRGIGYWLGGVIIDYWPLFMGILFIIIVLFAKGGIIGLTMHLWRSVTKRYVETT